MIRLVHERLQFSGPTGKFDVMLMLNAARLPQMRKAMFDREYLIPHVGLFRISSALQHEREMIGKCGKACALTFADAGCKW